MAYSLHPLVIEPTTSS